ncbi:hypothetical protein GQ43DRAFT_479151 [Delitschia confertaspora ATCC 74209]|uniref:Uncharacterized protein n=1 Tax=Delitschia confertaspora ATCC 74209 TaxID=1513339 RepID=A0A9P4JS15_9PLEO|nr:hypothetical protein GQ43DRAFT_479151 [Delitschia confertaspora ATCC 74209]
MSSVDLIPVQRDFLNQPSPYHDNFHETPIPHRPTHNDPISIFLRWRWRPQTILSTLGRIRYAHPSTSSPDSPENSDTSPEQAEPRSHPIYSDEGESAADRWLTLLFLFFLMSLILNFFLIFNGAIRPDANPLVFATSGKPPHPPYLGYTMHSKEKNYTCWQAETRELVPHYEYTDLREMYDYLWTEEKGGSGGILFKRTEKGDWGGERVIFGMFHQLHCLHAIRTALQHRPHQLEVWESSLDEKQWLQCFDYLRQVAHCNADDTLESVDGDEGGYNSPRVCRNHRWLYDVTACGEEGCGGLGFWNGKGSVGLNGELNERGI